MKKVSYTEVDVVKILDRNNPEHDLAWMEICNHHCTPYPKYGRYLLTQFWVTYSADPDENLQLAKEDWGSDWKGNGTLFKVVSDYLKKEGYEGDYEDVLLLCEW